MFAVTPAKQEGSRVSSPSAVGARQRGGQEGMPREGWAPQAGLEESVRATKHCSERSSRLWRQRKAEKRELTVFGSSPTSALTCVIRG